MLFDHLSLAYHGGDPEHQLYGESPEYALNQSPLLSVRLTAFG